MNIRTNQLDRTRTAIVEGAVDLLLEVTDPSEFTMQAVADRAGVSHRTLYRYFAGRRELVNAAGRALDERLSGGGWTRPETFDDWIAALERVLAFGATHRETLRRGLLLGVQSGEFRTDRDEMYWELFRRRFPNLAEHEARQDFVALRGLVSANNVILMGERFDMSVDDLVAGISRSVATLVADLDRRDREAVES